MSTLKTGTVQNNTGTGAPLFKNNSGTEIGQLVRAYANFDGTFGTSPFTEANGGIRDSFNVTSVTDNGTGNYTVNLAITMPNANYATIATIGGGSISNGSESTQIISRTTTTFQVYISSDGTGGATYTAQNASYVAAAIFGD